MATPDGFILVRAPVAGVRDEKLATSSPVSKVADDGKAKPSMAVIVSPSRSLRATMVSKRVKHPKMGALDVYSTVLTYVSGSTSDASGNLPGFWNVAQLTNAGGWSSFAVDFDLVRLRKMVVKFLPKLGWKTARSFTPLTSTAAQVLRIWSDPDGALGAPTIAQALVHVPGSKRTPTSDHSLVDPFTHTYVPVAPILRFNATTVRYLNLHDWCDTGDVSNYAGNTVVGGVSYNVLQAGSCPASTDIFSNVLEFHIELAIRAV